MKNKTSKNDIFRKDYDKIRQIQPRVPSESPKAPSSRSYARKPNEKNRKRRSGFASLVPRAISVFLALLIGFVSGLGCGRVFRERENSVNIDLKAIDPPSWIEQDFIRKNIFSRPDVTIKKINNIVIHYLANPNTSARNNRNFFDSLADQNPQEPGDSRSSHFIVGLEGEIIQCIPLSEAAYANAPRNFDTISIEVCHPDETGRFNPETYDSLVKLTARLCQELDLSSNDLLRHYDIVDKDCPKYFVEHEDAWKQFKKDVKKAIKK